MPLLKCKIYALPQMIEIGGKLWFKLRLEDGDVWEPDQWREPVDDDRIHSVVRDSGTHTTLHQQVLALMQRSMRDYESCQGALERGRWSQSDNTYVLISRGDLGPGKH